MSTETHVGYGWQTSTAAGRTLVELALDAKHQKLETYRTKNGERFKEYWLGIVSLGPGTPEDGGFWMLRERHFQSAYDRLLLLIHGPFGQLIGAEDVTAVAG